MLRKSTTLAVIVSAAVGLALAVALSKTRGGAVPAARQAAPQRIVCMAPCIAEAVFALGAGGRVVAVSQYTVYPPEAAARPTVGAVFNPNLERIASLKPDLVIVQEKHDKVEELCRARGIEVLRVEMLQVRTILEGIRTLGDRLGCPERAAALDAQIEGELAAVRRRVAGRPKVKVFLGVDRQPGSLKGLFTVGRASFLTELLDVAGGRNTFDDTESAYPAAQTEALLERAPEVILETYPSQPLSDEKRRALRADWQALGAIPAVRDGRIEFITDDYIVVPGPRIGQIAARFADALHPETAHAR